jgi:hypothetical protein
MQATSEHFSIHIPHSADFAENGQNRAKTWLFVHEKFNNIDSDQGEMVLYEQ